MVCGARCVVMTGLWPEICFRRGDQGAAYQDVPCDIGKPHQRHRQRDIFVVIVCKVSSFSCQLGSKVVLQISCNAADVMLCTDRAQFPRAKIRAMLLLWLHGREANERQILHAGSLTLNVYPHIHSAHNALYVASMLQRAGETIRYRIHVDDMFFEQDDLSQYIPQALLTAPSSRLGKVRWSVGIVARSVLQLPVPITYSAVDKCSLDVHLSVHTNVREFALCPWRR
jgi:hypothetical protein